MPCPNSKPKQKSKFDVLYIYFSYEDVTSFMVKVVHQKFHPLFKLTFFLGTNGRKCSVFERLLCLMFRIIFFIMQSRNQVANEALVESIPKITPTVQQERTQHLKSSKNHEGEGKVKKNSLKPKIEEKTHDDVIKASLKRTVALEKMMHSIRQTKIRRKEQNAFWYMFTLLITLLLGA